MIVNESLEFRDFGFEIEKTKDESPTLRILNGSERGGESMHHHGGAFSETLLIYGSVFKWCFEELKKSQQISLVSLGLGLGYVEVLACAFSLLHKTSFSLLSFERVPELRARFTDFYLKGQKEETYQWILQRTAQEFGLSPDALRERVKLALSEKEMLLRGDFVQESNQISGFHGFCYDAFSKKTSPELWDETFMTEVFKKGFYPSCVSTYASNGSLKRALSLAGFQIETLPGFQGKRNRTWALRLSP